VKPATIVAVFQKSLDTRAEVTVSAAAYKASLAERGAAESDRASYDDGLKAWVLNRYGADSPEAHEFGYAARKVSVKSAATKAQAVALNAATRKARGTVGKKEKLKIKGSIDAPQPAVAAPAAAPMVAVAPPTVSVAAAPAPVTSSGASPQPAVATGAASGAA
jgi:hypothetical protein